MDQEKIGKFIAKLRNEKNMTQQALAQKLGVTDRAVSNWENGRRMPDISLMKPLCDQLGITINELLSGERLAQEDYQNKLEENILNTLDYSNKKSKKARKCKNIFLGAIGLIVIIFISMYLVDQNRMANNKPVVFSTWGYEYCPPVDLPEGDLELAITEYLEGIGAGEVKTGEKEKNFADFKVYLIEQKHESLYYYYTWVVSETYHLEDGQTVKDGGYSLPQMFKIEKEKGRFVVTDSRTPRDGSYYEKDMEAIFPHYVRKDMEKISTDGTLEELRLSIEEQVKAYYEN